MIQLFLFLGIVMFAVFMMRRYFGTRGTAAWRGWLWLFLALVLLIAATGRLGLLIPVIGAAFAALLRFLPLLLPMLLQLLPVWLRRQRQAQYTRTQGGGEVSTAESSFLRMRLDHRSGEISGEVIKGHHAGKPLAELSQAQLVGLYAEYARADHESAALLQAYLDRVYGPDWQESTGTHEAHDERPRSGGKMSAEEARQVLGLESGASRDEIVSAHRRLMQRLHPDRGGSDYLAAKINQAKDVLLG